MLAICAGTSKTLDNITVFAFAFALIGTSTNSFVAFAFAFAFALMEAPHCAYILFHLLPHSHTMHHIAHVRNLTFMPYAI